MANIQPGFNSWVGHLAKGYYSVYLTDMNSKPHTGEHQRVLMNADFKEKRSLNNFGFCIHVKF